MPEGKLTEDHLKNDTMNDKFSQVSPNIAKELREETKGEKKDK